MKPEGHAKISSLSPEDDGTSENDNAPKKANGNNQLLPVMFFMHGGGFMAGESNLYGPKFLLDRNVILVTTNYRLGPLGFLNLGGNITNSRDLATGNQGLWDQREGNYVVQ